MLRCGLAVLTAAALWGGADAESLEANEGNWDKEVIQRVEKGQFVFAKFQAPL